ncbi:hypothetical protein ACWEQ4_01060 [Rhodococcus sp. NPDC003994]
MKKYPLSLILGMVAVVSSLLVIVLGGTWFGLACLVMGLVSLFAKPRVVVREVPAPAAPVAVGAWPWAPPGPVQPHPESVQSAPAQPEPELTRTASAEAHPADFDAEPTVEPVTDEPSEPSKTVLVSNDYITVGNPLNAYPFEEGDLPPGGILSAMLTGRMDAIRAAFDEAYVHSITDKGPFFDLNEIAAHLESDTGMVVGFFDPLERHVDEIVYRSLPTTRHATRDSRSGRWVDNGRMRPGDSFIGKDQSMTFSGSQYALFVTKVDGELKLYSAPIKADSEPGDEPKRAT